MLSIVTARLDGRVALVTGASRGAGRGIAAALGAEGSTVYVTGRSSRVRPRVAEFPHAVEDTADEVSAAGVAASRSSAITPSTTRYELCSTESGPSTVTSTCSLPNAWGGYMPYPEHNEWFAKPFGEQSMARWDGMFTAGLRAHMVTCLYGLPLLADTGYGLAVLTTFTRGRRYLGNVFYDVAKNAVCRLVSALAEEAKDSDLAIVGVSPGWMALSA
jgi:NAD(P)-dependent dehydrogenase (short-subunit alcohol dehydrogenase family)